LNPSFLLIFYPNFYPIFFHLIFHPNYLSVFHLRLYSMLLNYIISITILMKKAYFALFVFKKKAFLFLIPASNSSYQIH